MRGERQVLLGELHALRAVTAGGDPLAVLLTEGAALQVQARLALLDLAEGDAAALAEAARADRRPHVAATRRVARA